MNKQTVEATVNMEQQNPVENEVQPNIQTGKTFTLSSITWKRLFFLENNFFLFDSVLSLFLKSSTLSIADPGFLKVH